HAPVGRAGDLHGRVHGRALVQVARLAVQDHPHAATAEKRSGLKGATAGGGSAPVSRSATASAVIGVSSTPLRKWPVAQITLSGSARPISGELSGEPGRSAPRAPTNSSSETSGRTSQAASSSRYTPSAVTFVSKPR